jgi:hypothetical protein
MLFLMHVGMMSMQDKNPEVFSRTQYFLQNSEWCGKSSLKCQFCQIMAIDQTTGSVNGSVV